MWVWNFELQNKFESYVLDGSSALSRVNTAVRAHQNKNKNVQSVMG
jgi:hypothetical protein